MCVCQVVPSTLLSPLLCSQKKDVRMLRFIQEVNTSTRACALWDLQEDTEYIVQVRSISLQGSSPPSQPLLFRTPREAEKLASKSPGEEHTHTFSIVTVRLTKSGKSFVSSDWDGCFVIQQKNTIAFFVYHQAMKSPLKC